MRLHGYCPVSDLIRRSHSANQVPSSLLHPPLLFPSLFVHPLLSRAARPMLRGTSANVEGYPPSATLKKLHVFSNPEAPRPILRGFGRMRPICHVEAASCRFIRLPTFHPHP